MNKILTLLFVLYFLSDGYGQEKVTLQLQVFDCETKETLPFANVLSIYNETGTASNFEGNFYLETTTDDTLRITFIGYEQKLIAVREVKNLTQICLTPRSVNIQQVEISAKSDFLYELVSNCRKNRLTEELHSKTYFLLKSEINDTQVELVEAYYNGTYQNHDIQRLELKNGRIYLSKFEKSSYVSMGTSTGINLHKTFDFNLYFPASPLEWNELKLKKKFQLSFVKKFEEGNQTIYVVDFKEREKEGKFYGRLWLDSTNFLLKKIRLQSEEGGNSPFVAAGNADKITSIKFDITKSYERAKGINTIKSVDFNYTLRYRRKDKKEITVETKAALFAYEYNNTFILPFFEKSYRLNDYQGINLAPYNKSFWEDNNEFKLMAKESEKRLFIESNTTNLIDSFSYDPIIKEISFTKPTYRKWSLNRMNLSDIKDNSTARRYLNVYLKYNLDVKIFMNIDQIGRHNDVQLVTIFDPFTSYSNLENNTNSLAFINMYFDLVEIKKRELQRKLTTNLSAEVIQDLYEQTKSELVEISRDFFTETAGGTNKKGMTDWNEYIYKRLKIDNLEYFQVQFKY